MGALAQAVAEVMTFPRVRLDGATRRLLPRLTPSVAPRYSGNRFTPDSVLRGAEPTTGDYLRAFFTPDGTASMGAGPRQERPRALPPPGARPAIARVHAGPLGPGGPALEVGTARRSPRPTS